MGIAKNKNNKGSSSYINEILNEGDKIASRRVYFNISLPSIALNKYGVPIHKYVKNKIRTSKYTLLTFIPGNLYEQFHRVANMFFLFMVTIQAFPVFGVVNPLFAALPLICIITVTAIKDGYEDLKRHKEDDKVNNTPAYILDNWTNTNFPKYNISFTDRIKSIVLNSFYKVTQRVPNQVMINLNENDKIDSFEKDVLKTDDSGETLNNETNKLNKEKSNVDMSINPDKKKGWKKVPWKDVRVGDIILLSANENIPADIVILSTSEEENECYVETKNLDGETTLKRRSGRKETQCIRDVKSAKNLRFVIKAENPVVNLYEFKSRIELPEEEEETEYDPNNNYDNKNNMDQNENDEVFPNGYISVPLDITNLLLRGSVIRNTEWVIGAVIYTGDDTKLRLNSGNTPSKRSRIEKLMNPQIVFNFFILFSVSVVVAYVNTKIIDDWNRKETPFFLSRDMKFILKFLRTFGSTMIMMQNVVPISLYISVEVAKTIQSWFIHEDLDLYYEETDSPCNTKTWNISDDLGQIEYVFSDKTGTLTQNKMEFMRCSIIGKIYGKGYTDVTRDIEGYTIEETKLIETDLEQRMKNALFSYYKNPYLDKSTRFSFLDEQLIADLKNENSLQGKAVYFFFQHLALCHSVLSPKNVVLDDGTETSYLEYCAESPDEQALVITANNLGFSFVRRTENSITINCLGKEETYEVLHILEFNSVRKRMSVILRTPKNEILLLCKGADTIIYQRLQKNQDNLRTVTFSHLEKFGSEGLRTLCIAYRYINPNEYKKWNEDYHKAEVSLEDRDQLKDDLASAIETNLVLLGVTAIEDKLQEGVPDCISTLQEAGIKIWVLTGDKLETAINIGFASNLLNRSMCLLAIRERNVTGGLNDSDQTNSVQTQLKNAYTIVTKYGKKIKKHHQGGVWRVINPVNDEIKNLKSKFIDRNQKNDRFEYEMELKNFQSLNRNNKNKHVSNVSMSSLASGKSMSDVIMGQQAPLKGIDFALIVDGQSLLTIMEKEDLRKRFLETATRCRAVICCRVSPKQKAQVVNIVKDGLKVLCLSIGDGANDISMIQEANVGVGIAGQEGMQAAMSSDYAISQFRYLSKLLMVHGRWSYIRVSNMIMNFFYKNIVWVFTLFWYQFSCGFSAQILFDYSLVMFFNFIFTSMPVMVVGVFDKDLSKETIYDKPQLYETMGLAQKKFTWKRFFAYVIDAIYQSLVCYFIPYHCMAYNSFSNGLSPDSYYFGNIIANYVITLVNLCVAINMSSINWISAVTLIFEMLSFNIFFPIYVALPVRKTYREYLKLMIFDIKFWLLYVIVIVFALFPRIIIKYYKSNYMPEDSDIYREIEKYHLEDHEGYNDLEKGDKIRYSVTEKLSQLDQHKVPQVPLSTSISPTGTGLPIIKEEEENVESGTGIGTGTGTETEAGKENKVSFYPSKYPESEIDESVVSGGYDESIYNEASVLFKRQSYTPSENGNLSLDRKHKAMSIRSSRSRRNNILKQGTSADGNAMSVIFMDNNEEYVNTGFAFAYNDEEELFNRSRSKNPLYKAKSVDDIYEDKRRKRHKNRRENFSYAGRRQSQPEFIFKPFTKLNEN